MTKGVQDRMVAVARVRDAFHRAVFQSADVDAALSLADENCVFVNLPSGQGASGLMNLRRHLADEVIPHLPADLEFRSVSRTGDRWRFVTEDIVSFTHDRDLPWLLPGIAPTGRRAEVLAVSIVSVPGRHELAIVSHRTLWDHRTLIAQLGVADLDAGGPTGAG